MPVLAASPPDIETLLLIHPVGDRHDVADVRLVRENKRNQDLLGKVLPPIQIHRSGHYSTCTLPLRILKHRRNDLARLDSVEDLRKSVHAAVQPNLSEQAGRL